MHENMVRVKTILGRKRVMLLLERSCWVKPLECNTRHRQKEH